MDPEARRKAIAALVRERGRMAVNDLSRALSASCETIRRDLGELERRRLVRKVHGGAVLPEPAVFALADESPFKTRMNQMIEEKRRIARAASGLMKRGDVLFVDTGTTTLLFGEELSRQPGLTVISNSGLIASMAARAQDATVIRIGGDYRLDGAETLGPVAIEQIGLYQASHAVLTVAALGEGGAQDVDPAEAAVARAMAARAHRTILLADSSKFGRSAPYTAIEFSRVDTLVTDRMPEGRLLRMLEDEGVHILVA